MMLEQVAFALLIGISVAGGVAILCNFAWWAGHRAGYRRGQDAMLRAWSPRRLAPPRPLPAEDRDLAEQGVVEEYFDGDGMIHADFRPVSR